MSKKLTSIIIPLFNAEKYLKETLESVLFQTYSNWECIIVDDGSTDTSKIIALEYCKKDMRFKYYYTANSGPSASRNFGLKRSSGYYIQFLDADDVILPRRLELMLKLNVGLKNNVILYSNFFCGGGTNIYNTSAFSRPVNIGKDVTFDDMYRKFGQDFLFIPACLFFPRRAVIGIKWNEKLNHSEDWDYYLSILKKNFIFRYIDTPLVIYRNTPDSLSKNISETLKANYTILSKWADNINLVYVTKRCALLFKKNIIFYLLKKTNVIIKPHLYARYKSLRMCLFLFLLYAWTLFFLILEILGILLKKRKNN